MEVIRLDRLYDYEIWFLYPSFTIVFALFVFLNFLLIYYKDEGTLRTKMGETKFLAEIWIEHCAELRVNAKENKDR